MGAPAEQCGAGRSSDSVRGVRWSAFGLARGEVKGAASRADRRDLLRSLLFPPYVLANGWFQILGRQGILARAIGLSDAAGAATSDWLFSLAGGVLSIFEWSSTSLRIAISDSPDEAAVFTNRR